MSFLYHGSAYETKVLQPGFNFSKVLVEWDETESNKFLYATPLKDLAIVLGIISGVEKRFNLTSSNIKGKTITLCFEDEAPEEINFNIYLYKCEKNADWTLVRNEVNNLKDEYKTDKKITPVDKKKIDSLKWLNENNYTVILKVR